MLKKELLLFLSGGKMEKTFYGRYKVTVGEYEERSDYAMSSKTVNGVTYECYLRDRRGYESGLIPYSYGSYELLEGEDLTPDKYSRVFLHSSILYFDGLSTPDYDMTVSAKHDICGKRIDLVNETTGKTIALSEVGDGDAGGYVDWYLSYSVSEDFYEGIEVGQECTIAIYYYKEV